MWIALVAYAAATLWLTLHHEAWCNEADTWLLMRDGGVRVMLANTGRAGTPALWYLCLAPLASAGLPYLAQQLLNLAFIWTAMLLFLLFAHFRPLLKVLFLFSLYPAVEYAVQARPYALLVLLLFGIATLWPDRAEKAVRIALLVALLANTTAHGLLFGAILGVLLLGEAIAQRRLLNGRSLAAMAVMLAGGILAVIQLSPQPGGQQLQIERFIDPTTVPYAVGMAFFPDLYPRDSFAPALLILLIVVLAIGWRRLVPQLFVVLSVAALLTLFSLVWMGGRYHAGLILIAAIVGLWMAGSRPVAEAALLVALAWSVFIAGEQAVAEIRWAHSGSREMAAYIARHVPPSAVIAAHPPAHTESVLVYLPGRRFWCIARGAFGSYMPWGAKLDHEQELPMRTAVEMGKRTGWLLLVNQQLSGPEATGLRLLYRTREPVYARRTEQFWLYAPAGSERGHLPAE